MYCLKQLPSSKSAVLESCYFPCWRASFALLKQSFCSTTVAGIAGKAHLPPSRFSLARWKGSSSSFGLSKKEDVPRSCTYYISWAPFVVFLILVSGRINTRTWMYLVLWNATQPMMSRHNPCLSTPKAFLTVWSLPFLSIQFLANHVFPYFHCQDLLRKHQKP